MILHTDPKQLYYLHQWYHLPISGTGHLPSVVPSPLSGTISHQWYHLPLSGTIPPAVSSTSAELSCHCCQFCSFTITIPCDCSLHIRMTNDCRSTVGPLSVHCWTTVSPLLDRGLDWSVRLTHFPASVSLVVSYLLSRTVSHLLRYSYTLSRETQTINSLILIY